MNKRKTYKKLAEHLGIKIKWYYTNKKISFLCQKEIASILEKSFKKIERSFEKKLIEELKKNNRLN